MNEDKTPTHNEIRLCYGEAWMWCKDCNAKLFSFDGSEDAIRNCPYKKHPNDKCEGQ